MAITIGNDILYNEVRQKAIDMIVSKCSNIGAFAANVPASLKNGQTFTIASSSRCKATATVSDSLLVTVPLSTVTSQFDAFMKDRGIYLKEDEVINFKAMMNFFNNVSSFISTKLVSVANSFGSGNFIYYNAGATGYQTVNVGRDETYTPTEITNSVSEMLGIINNVSKIHYATSTITYTCSSSSSSSSSSSCSSSSSLFIAYMEI